MANIQQVLFGGAWTQKKLESLAKYLRAYLTIFEKNKRAGYFRTTYVDAFAGTGYMQKPEMPLIQLVPELYSEVMANAGEYHKGSAVRALELKPGFDHYLFIERSQALAFQLENLKVTHPDKASRIQIINGDANVALQNWARKVDWTRNRAVVFLDPFGMQVEWNTIRLLADTKGVDLWILFPLFGVNRMLTRTSTVPDSWRERLSRVFGTDAWESEFYHTESSTLFEDVKFTRKVADANTIANYFVNRLRSVFVAVAPPQLLLNSKGRPLFLLCFAAGNERGAPTALKIARNILEN
jgi:three-Cys-motif partner protein